MYFLFAIVSFGASVIGAICGIGGGIIIKPALDAFRVLSVATISFLSGCTVLAMSGYTVICSKLKGKSKVEVKVGTPLAMGAAIGGVAGKLLFQIVTAAFENKEKIGAVQAAWLIVITIGTLIYSINKEKISTHQFTRPIYCALIGGILGMLSSFLGIGGGPINLVVLLFFFSMTTKVAVENSIYIIFISQAASLINMIFTKSVPDFDLTILIIMVCGGIAGGAVGRKINKRIAIPVVDKLFIILMVAIIFMNIYNMYQYVCVG